MNKLYLPMTQGGSSSQLESTTQTSDDSEEPYPGYIPFEQLPECPDIPPIDQTQLPPPDDSVPICRVRIVNFLDVGALIEEGADLSQYNLGADPVLEQAD